MAEHYFGEDEREDCLGGCVDCYYEGGCPYEDDDPYDEDLFDEDQDSGFLGSMLEAQLVREGQELCPDCQRKISSILDETNPNPCKNEEHQSFKRLFEVRIKIGLQDLKTRGYD